MKQAAVTLRSWMGVLALVIGSGHGLFAASPARHHENLDINAFLAQDAVEIAAGRQLVDIEVRDTALGTGTHWERGRS